MKLGSLRSGKSRDGQLVVIRRDLKFYALASHICPTLREAIENWASVSPALESFSQKLNEDLVGDKFPYNENEMLSALPRTAAK